MNHSPPQRSDRGSKMRISLCMIAKDAADQLESCLASVRGVVDEVCLVDTGSNDGTGPLARALGARVAQLPWKESFAEARNASLAMARGDWILVLDADEELIDEHARAAFERFATAGAHRLGRLFVESVDDDGAVIGREAITRFFPARRGLRFEGRVHEQVVAPDRTFSREDVGVRVRHTGYAASELRKRGKLRRNRTLLERALAEDGEDPYLCWQLARTRLLADDPAGAWEAAERARARVRGDESWAHALVETAADALRALARPAEARALLERDGPPAQARPDRCFRLGLCALDEGRLETAEAWFRRSLELGPGEADDPGTATWAPAHNLGVMCEVLGLAEEARQFYGLALAHRPGHGPSREALARLEART